MGFTCQSCLGFGPTTTACHPLHTTAHTHTCHQLQLPAGFLPPALLPGLHYHHLLSPTFSSHHYYTATCLHHLLFSGFHSTHAVRLRYTLPHTVITTPFYLLHTPAYHHFHLPTTTTTCATAFLELDLHTFPFVLFTYLPFFTTHTQTCYLGSFILGHSVQFTPTTLPGMHVYWIWFFSTTHVLFCGSPPAVPTCRSTYTLILLPVTVPAHTFTCSLPTCLFCHIHTYYISDYHNLHKYRYIYLFLVLPVHTHLHTFTATHISICTFTFATPLPPHTHHHHHHSHTFPHLHTCLLPFCLHCPFYTHFCPMHVLSSLCTCPNSISLLQLVLYTTTTHTCLFFILGSGIPHLQTGFPMPLACPPAHHHLELHTPHNLLPAQRPACTHSCHLAFLPHCTCTISATAPIPHALPIPPYTPAATPPLPAFTVDFWCCSFTPSHTCLHRSRTPARTHTATSLCVSFTTPAWEDFVPAAPTFSSATPTTCRVGLQCLGLPARLVSCLPARCVYCDYFTCTVSTCLPIHVLPCLCRLFPVASYTPFTRSVCLIPTPLHTPTTYYLPVRFSPLHTIHTTGGFTPPFTPTHTTTGSFSYATVPVCLLKLPFYMVPFPTAATTGSYTIFCFHLVCCTCTRSTSSVVACINATWFPAFWFFLVHHCFRAIHTTAFGSTLLPRRAPAMGTVRTAPAAPLHAF